MTVRMLAERLVELAQQLHQEGITLWGGDSLYELAAKLGGEVLIVEPHSGCVSETCRHVSHDPAAPTYKWVPPAGAQLVWLGGETTRDEALVDWYAVFQDGHVQFIEVYEPRAYHGSAELVDNVPEWALAELHRRAAEKGE